MGVPEHLKHVTSALPQDTFVGQSNFRLISAPKAMRRDRSSQTTHFPASPSQTLPNLKRHDVFKDTSAHLISGWQSLVSGRRRRLRRNPTRLFVSDSRSRPAHRFWRRSETGVVSIGALQTDMWTGGQTEVSVPERSRIIL